MATLQGIPRGYEKGSAGIKYVLVGQYDALTVTQDASANATFKAADASSAVAAGTFKKYYMLKQTSSWTDAGTSNPQNGTIVYAPTLNLVFGKNEALKRQELAIMGKKELVVVAVDQNDYACVLGGVNGLDLTTGTMQSGTALGDLAGLSITLTGSEPLPHGIVSDIVLATLYP
jgi:hypothetical protein